MELRLAPYRFGVYLVGMDAYLSDISFAAPHTGPHILDRLGKPRRHRDPSQQQIRRMAEAIQRTWTLREERLRRGDAPEWALPTVAVPATVGDLSYR